MVYLVPYDASFAADTLVRISNFWGFHASLVPSADEAEKVDAPSVETGDGGAREPLAEWLLLPNRLFVIMDDAVSVGFVRINNRGPNVAWIEDIYVDTAHRGRGIASAAIAAAEVIVMQTPGYTAVCMDVSPRNENALRLYHKLGYVDLPLVTVRKELYGGRRDKPIQFLGMEFKY